MEKEKFSIENLPQVLNTQISPSISDLFKKGMHDYRHHDYNGAIEIFQSIISTNPELAEAHVNLGDAYFRLDQTQEAIDCWKKALSLDSTQVSCYINIGNGCFLNNNVAEAIKHWLIAITMAPDHTTALMNLGAAYEQLKDMSQAFKYYEEFLKYYPKDGSSTYQKINSKVTKSKKVAEHNLKSGFYYQKRNNLRKAAMCYLNSIKAYPNFAKAHLNMGSICYMAKKYTHAIKYWKQAVNVDPTYDNTYCNLGVAYEIIKKYELAFCMYTKFKEMGGNSYQIDERLKQLTEFLNKHPGVVGKRLEKADEFYSKQKYTESLWEYENYIILKPDQKNSFEHRINELKNYLNPVFKAANTAYEIGNTCFSQGKYDKAIHAYRRYLILNSDGEYKTIVNKKISDCAKHMGKTMNSFAKAGR
ncbi:MAG: tetratricopeptide repeat protein [Candidatus Gastranaerophilales bacterium]|nr:tetratricopeptide repeat protein [Candidatus Gastranaerophilales bacterium]